MPALRGSIRRVVVGTAALLGVTVAATGHADEGQWMPKQLAKLDQAQLRGMGLTLAADELWNEKDGGLMKAAVNLSGCSAGFLSDKGLLATNHHCAYGAIAAGSSVEHDYLRDGFYAPAVGDEIPAKGSTVKVLESIKDVTKEIRAVADGQSDAVARTEAVHRARAKMVADCEAANPGDHCQVAEFYNGYEYQLLRYIELLDVRLVYAPPSSVGNYGGEVDNWMWPRHTGDFSLLRAYVGPDGKPAAHSDDNVPYTPTRHFTVSPEGVGPGDFVAILGYPGRTHRYLPAVEMQRQLDQFLPARVDLYGRWIEILERQGAADPAVRIKVAAKLRSLANRHKNARGMIDGIKRNGLLEKRTREDEALTKWAEGQGDTYEGVLSGLSTLTAGKRASFERDFVLDNLSSGAGSLAVAIDLVRRAREQAKPDLERRSTYQDRGVRRLKERLQQRLRDFDMEVDQQLVAVLFARAEALPADQRVTGYRVADVARALRATKVTDEAFAMAAFEAADAEALEASRDPLIMLANELVDSLEERLARKDSEAGTMLVLGPQYFQMLEKVRGGPVYPDANGTMRLSYASVRGYSPRDGLVATPQTVLAGQLAKHTGEPPFDLPQAVRDAAPKASQTYWADPGLGDVPVDFLSNGDTTGGNSGSPVVDGQGRLVGLNFDRVWENIAGDYGYNVDRSRNVIVDIRYLLWTLDEVVDAGPLLKELGVADKRPLPAKTSRAPSGQGGDAAAGDAVHSDAGAKMAGAAAGEGLVGTPLAGATPEGEARRAQGGAGCACAADSRQRSGPLAWMWLPLLLGLRRVVRRG